MEELESAFENFKISALSKSKKINSFIKNVTIGPNQYQPTTEKHISENNESKPSHTFDDPVNTADVQMKKIVNEIELQRREEVQKAIVQRINSFKENTEKQKVKNLKGWQNWQYLLLDKIEQEEMSILEALRENEREKIENHERLVAYYQELAERKKQNEEKIKLNEQQRKQRADIINRLKKKQEEFREVYQEITTIFRNYKHVEIRTILEDLRRPLQSFPDCMNEIVERCQSGKISEKDALKSEEYVQQLKALKDKIVQRIEANEAEKKKETAKSKVKEVSNQAESNKEDQVDTEESNISVNQNTSKNNEDIAVLNKYINKSSIKFYSELQDFFKTYPTMFKDILQDNSLKQFRFNCKKAINIPVNAISAVSPQHLIDKYNRLSSLLLGHKVVVGGTEVIASKHPQGIAFCTDLLAKQFVLQGDLMISSKPEAAFCYATVILSLWNQFPDFGKLFVLHLHKECPYLIPFYPPRLVGQTDEEFYKSQGYHYVDGAVEKHDKFLKRLTGITRLYAAIVISKPKRDQKNSPHNIANGWRWFSSFLNLEPRIDVSATMIHTFLEIAGTTMQDVYGKHFTKLMNYLCNIYMPMLQKFDTGGPYSRLELLLQEYKRTGYFEKPNGMLPLNFW